MSAELQAIIDSQREAIEVLQWRLQAMQQEATEFELPGIEHVHLTGIERTVAYCLHRHVGKVVSKDMLHQQLYALRVTGDETPGPKIIDVIICKLRKKLKAAPLWKIETAWGHGYSLQVAA